MFRISLIKIIITPILALLVNLSWAADSVKILNEEGQPILHALIQVGNQKPLSVNELGEISLSKDELSERVLVFAMGYETQSLSLEKFRELSENLRKINKCKCH